MVAAALLSVALGLFGVFTPAEERTPAWSARLQPLTTAPLETGGRAGLAVPEALDAARAKPLLYECAWLRPDVRWLLIGFGGNGAPLDHVVRVGPAPVPDGWCVAWEAGGVQVLAPVDP